MHFFQQVVILVWNSGQHKPSHVNTPEFYSKNLDLHGKKFLDGILPLTMHVQILNFFTTFQDFSRTDKVTRQGYTMGTFETGNWLIVQ